MYEQIWRETDCHLLRQEGDLLGVAATEEEAREAARRIAEEVPGLILEVETAPFGGYGVIAVDMTEEEERRWLKEMGLPHWLHDDVFIADAWLAKKPRSDMGGAGRYNV